MGCVPSVHPSIYDESHKGESKLFKKKAVETVDANSNRQMKGDYSQLQAAKYMRNMQRKDRQLKLFAAANEMSGRLMEEREMLSLGTRSRGTSRATSRAGSPANNKKMSPLKAEEQVAPMTPVTENDIASRGSDRRDTGQPNGHAIVDDPKKVDAVEKDKTAVKDSKSSKKKRKTKTKSKTSKPKGHKKSKRSRKDTDKHDDVSDSEDETIDPTSNYVQLALPEPHSDDNAHNELVHANKDADIEHSKELNDVRVTNVRSADSTHTDSDKGHRIVSQNSISVAPGSPEVANDATDNSHIDIT